jgi:hypothetical protein
VREDLIKDEIAEWICRFIWAPPVGYRTEKAALCGLGEAVSSEDRELSEPMD